MSDTEQPIEGFPFRLAPLPSAPKGCCNAPGSHGPHEPAPDLELMTAADGTKRLSLLVCKHCACAYLAEIPPEKSEAPA